MEKTMCTHESEMLIFQLYLYARRKKPGLAFDRDRLATVLREWEITRMRQLFDLPPEARIAITLPLMSTTVRIGDRIIYREAA